VGSSPAILSGLTDQRGTDMKHSHPSTFRRRVRRSIGGLAVAGGVAALAFAAAPAMASPSTASITGPLTINGTVHGKAALANVTKVPLVYRGVVNTSGVLALGNGHATTHTLKTGAGHLTLTQTAKPAQSQTENAKTCHLSFGQDLALKLDPGKSTGSFAGATGKAAVDVTFSGTMPRYTSGPHKGQCNFGENTSPITKTAVASFVGAAIITTP
jgi:hypothetical protein